MAIALFFYISHSILLFTLQLLKHSSFIWLFFSNQVGSSTPTKETSLRSANFEDYVY